MSEILHIKNFGPIEAVSISLKEINLLIGDQGTGKSLIAKTLIAVRNSIFLEIFDLKPNDKLSKATNLFLGHLDLVGLQSYLHKDTFISYSYKGYSLKYSNQTATITGKENISIGEALSFNFNYIPAERNMVSVLADSLYALLQVQAELPKLFLRFGNKYQTARKFKERFEYSEILGVDFLHANDKDYIITKEGIQLDLMNASSGIQGCVAMLTVIDSILQSPKLVSQNTLPITTSFNLLVTEEPEIGCFPNTQNKLIRYIVENNKGLMGYKNQLFFTTHSPYVLTSINNLMYAYKIGIANDKVANVVSKKYWLNPEDVSCYLLKTDGTCESIIDEDGLIKAEKIDEVSDKINTEYAQIGEIRYGG